MINPSDIIKATGSDPSKPMSDSNPLGTGHIFHMGRVFKCSGLLGPNPRFAEDSAAGFNPPQEMLLQHVIMTLQGVPADCQAAGVLPSERADQGQWELDPSQESIDPTKPVCQVCGQPIVS